MKVFLAALIAGLIGGGATVGAVASGMVSLESLGAPKAKTASTVSSDADIAALQDENAGLQKSIANQNKELADLRSKYSSTKADLDALNAKLDAKADKDALDKLAKQPAPKEPKTEGAPAEASTGSKVETQPESEMRKAVRSELEAIRKEEEEQRRLNRQAQRIEALEKLKAQVAESIPKTLTSQQKKLNLTDQQIKVAGTALITHAQRRLEILSGFQEKRIDGEDIDRDTEDAQLADLDTASKAALMGIVDEKTAESLLSMTNKVARLGGGNTQPTGRRAARGN